MRNLMSALVVLLLAASVAPAAENPKSKAAAPVEIRVTRVYENISITLPPGMAFEIPGVYLSHTEIEKTRTRIHLRAPSLEIYTVKDKTKAPKGVKIEAFQVGPGFCADPAWKVVFGD